MCVREIKQATGFHCLSTFTKTLCGSPEYDKHAVIKYCENKDYHLPCSIYDI